MSTDTAALADQEHFETGTELATTQANQFADAALTQHRSLRQWDNFVGDADERFMLASMATGPDVLPGEDLIGQAFNLKFWFCHDAILNGDLPGEIIEALRVVLITDEGKSYSFVSDGIVQGLQQLVRYKGVGPWSPAPLLKVVKLKTSKGRNYYKLAPANITFS